MKTKTVITVLIVAFILASCAQATKIVPTETTVPTSTFTPVPPTPTITPTQIPTIEIEGQNFPDPHFSNPELFNLEQPNAPIPQFAHALNLAGVDVTAQNISKSLIYEVVKAKNGDMAILLMTTDLPETPYNESDIPLLIYMKDQKTSQYAWGKAFLKNVAGLHNILMGALINSAEEMDLNEKTGIFTDNFNVATIPYDFGWVPQDILDRDTKYRLSRIKNEKIDELMFFHLGWSASQGAAHQKFFSSEDEGVKYINDEIDKIVRKYGYKITIASILNEIHPGYPAYIMWKNFGDKYLLDIYDHARKVLPDAKLIYNETYNYSKNHEGTYYPYTLKIAKVLKENNLIDAVGMQMHMAQNEGG